METTASTKRTIENGPGRDAEAEEDIEAKKRRILADTRDIDAASDSGSESSEEESEDEEDETAELLRELEKIKRERAEKKEQEEKEKAAQEQEERESDIALGNPLLMPQRDNETKRRWDDDVVFRNQARGTEKKGKPEFVNDLLRSDFHKRFMVCICLVAFSSSVLTNHRVSTCDDGCSSECFRYSYRTHDQQASISACYTRPSPLQLDAYLAICKLVWPYSRNSPCIGSTSARLEEIKTGATRTTAIPAFCAICCRTSGYGLPSSYWELHIRGV